jgi:hypothetical protein
MMVEDEATRATASRGGSFQTVRREQPQPSPAFRPLRLRPSLQSGFF